MNRKLLFVLSVAALVLVFVAGTQFYRSERSAQSNAAAGDRAALLVRFHSPSVGNAGARVQIVEFIDPACETCREFYPFVKSLLAGNPDKVRLSMRHVAFHEGSEFAVRALLAARRQGKYWPALEALLAAQPKWAVNHVVRPEAVLPALGSVGLDIEQLKRDMNDPEITRIIEQDQADARALKVTKTPGYFVNGREMPTFGFEQLKRLVDEEVANAYR